MVRNTPKNAEPTAKAKLPPFVRGLLCIGTVLLVCFVVSIVLEVWYCKSAPNAAIKLAACLVLDAFAFLLPEFSTKSKILETVDSPNGLVTCTRSSPV